MRVCRGIGSTAAPTPGAPALYTRQTFMQPAWEQCNLAARVTYRCSTHQQPPTLLQHGGAASSSNQWPRQHLLAVQHVRHTQLQPSGCYLHSHIHPRNQQAANLPQCRAVVPLSRAGQRRVRCCSSGAGSQNSAARQEQGQDSNQPAVQQQQQQQQQPPLGEDGSMAAGRNQSAAGMPHLLHMQPPPQPVRVPPLLSWLPPWMVLHLQALAGFVRACWELLPEFVAPTLPEALRRLVLVLGASLVMIVVVCTIDSGWLYLYLMNARRVAVAA